MSNQNQSWGILPTQQDEDNTRAHAVNDPAGYHAGIAGRELHWFDGNTQSWISQTDTGEWAGWHDRDASSAHADASWQPWSHPLDDSLAPYYRWFVDGQTNACFNLIDRHVLSGRGDQIAIIFEGDRWDPSKNDGRGGPVHEQRVTYRELLVEVALRTRVLKQADLSCGDRVALNLPNVLEQIFYMRLSLNLQELYLTIN